MSPLSFLRASGVIFHFISFSDKIHVSKQNSPTWDAASCGVTSGAILFAMSHKNDAVLILVKANII